MSEPRLKKLLVTGSFHPEALFKGGGKIPDPPSADDRPVVPETPDTEPKPTRTPWIKLAAIVLVVLVVVAVAALLVRRPNRSPTLLETTWTPATPTVDGTVTFSAQATDPDGDALSFTWDFGDGSFGTGAPSLHAYGIPGNFTAYVIVSDGKGGEATSEANLLRLEVLPDVSVPGPCGSANCAVGPMAAVLDAAPWTATPGVSIALVGNFSWAYVFSWNNPANHSQGGTYVRDVAWQNSTLFERFEYSWGDGSPNTTGASALVGNTTHAFARPGTYVVRLTVTHLDAALGRTTNATAGVTIRIAQPATVYGADTLRPMDAGFAARSNLGVRDDRP